jgi:DNA-binding transcriptional regulator YdaS (Cro superfamily)
MAAASSLPSNIRGLQQRATTIGNALAIIIGNAYDVVMNAIQRAVEHSGGQAQLAAALGVKQPTVSEWARGERPVPIERCVAIEQATAGAVRRWDLRPDDWPRIWPELIGAEGAPAIPAEQGAA